MKRTPFASGTTVSPEKTRAEIETTLNRYGAKGFGYMTFEQRARVEFVAHNRRVRFDLVTPAPGEKRFWSAPGYRRRTPQQAQSAWEAEVRRLWRALLLVIKAKLEVVASGIAIFEHEFLSNIVLPDNRTVAEHVLPAIAAAYESGQVRPMLPAMGETEVGRG